MQFYLNYILLCIIFYLIGSIPTAYLMVKSKNIDIRKAGSGNSGALNSYEVTKSKKIGILVLLFDFLKGLVPSYLLIYVLQTPFQYAFIPVLLLIVGHNFSVWLGFKGGRGLASSAGISIAVNFWILLIWCVLFLLSNLIKKNVHLGNILASIFSPVVLLIKPDFFVKFFCDYSRNIETDINSNFQLLFAFSTSAMLLILISHIKPIVQLLKKNS
jgi:acyl phosphate:glycerol-3-phosphate acyltransferase